jgi:hypothetical protein
MYEINLINFSNSLSVHFHKNNAPSEKPPPDNRCFDNTHLS